MHKFQTGKKPIWKEFSRVLFGTCSSKFRVPNLGEFIEQQGNYQLFKNGPKPMSQLIAYLVGRLLDIKYDILIQEYAHLI
jgi:hypothetical protein